MISRSSFERLDDAIVGTVCHDPQPVSDCISRLVMAGIDRDQHSFALRSCSRRFLIGAFGATEDVPFPVQGAEAVLLPNRAPTDRNGNGRLDLNGIEYMPVTGKVFGTVRFQGVNPDAPPQESDDTYLILLTLDVLAGQPNQPTSVGLDVFKADETASSDSVDFVCWTRVLLRTINPDFTAAVMGRKGLVESTSAIQGGRAVTLLGLVETVEYATPPDIRKAWLYLLNTGGRPVLTTFGP